MQVSLKDYMGNEIDDKYVILSARMTEKSSEKIIQLRFRKCGHALKAFQNELINFCSVVT
jgi:uncharacterized protein YfdQ (DUF2303 family)